jgi:hemolysin activation/secretion protein
MLLPTCTDPIARCDHLARPKAPCNRPHWTRVHLVTAVMACSPALALAQTPPAGAGQLLEETRRPAAPTLPSQAPPKVLEAPVRPSISMPEGLFVTVSGFRITGAVSFAPDLLAGLIQPWVGKKLDIRGLNEAAGALTRHYQANGHLLSYAYLPAQRVADGVIELAVLEGRIEGVQIVTAQDVRLRDEVVQAHTDRVVGPGPALQPGVERQLLLLNDIPGVTARAAFTPGAATGGAEMVVSVAEDEPLEVRVDASNHGSVSTGQYRAGISLQLRDLFGWGDSINARGMLSNRGGLVTGALSGSLPLGGDGWKLGASLSRLEYQLAGTFRNTGAQGKADTLGVDLGYPLLRSTSANLSLRAGLEHKRLRDDLVAILESTQKRNDVGELTAAFDFRDPLDGLTAGSATVSVGQLRTAGMRRQEWRKLSAQLARQQNVYGPWSVYTRLSGQTAGANLDSSEKLGLDGANGVRAYAPGEASVDHGGVASLELRYSLDLLGGGLVASLFHDYGGGQINRSTPGAVGNDPELNGTGIGIAWSGNGIGLNATLAWRGSRVPTTDPRDPRPRLFFQVSYLP